MACEPGESCLLLCSENLSACLHTLSPQPLRSDSSEQCLECGLLSRGCWVDGADLAGQACIRVP